MVTDHTNPDRAWMTPLLNRIADVAGERAALVLATEKAGQLIYIPSRLTAEHWLSTLIGPESAVALVSVYGARYITIPPVMVGDKRRRARVLADLIARGYSINRIVALTGVSRSTVIEHRARRPGVQDEPDAEDAEQPDLF